MKFKNRKILRPSFRVMFVLSYIIIITLFDVYSYGIVYQQKIKKDGYNNSFWSWVFWESAPSGEESKILPLNKGEVEGVEYHVTIPHYRIIQKSIELIGSIIIFYFCGFWSAFGLIISHYLLTYDLLFYLFLNQTYLFYEFQHQYPPYWLQNWYQVGYLALQPFNPVIFYICGFGGTAVAVFLSLVSTKKHK